MNRALRTLLGTVLALHMADLHARPGNFAAGISVSPPAGETSVRFELPDAVYQTVVLDDLEDTAMYNAAGEPVPFAYQLPPTPHDAQHWHEAPLFALAPHPATDTSERVVISASGTVISVRGPAQGQPAAAYIVDASGFDWPVRELRLDWAPKLADQVLQVGVAGSDDLDRWSELGSGVLTELSSDTQVLSTNVIPLHGTRKPYLKLEVLGDGATLTRADVGRTARVARTERSRNVVLKEDLTFDTGGGFVLSGISMTAADAAGFAFDAELYSRNDDHAPWRRRGRHRFSLATRDGEQIDRTRFNVNEITDRYWRLEAMSAVPSKLAVTVHYVPHAVIFLTQGGGPFVLAYGSGRPPDTPTWKPDELLDAAGVPVAADIVRVTPGNPLPLGGDDALAVPISSGQLLLWGVLGLGSLIVITLAFSLFRASDRPS